MGSKATCVGLGNAYTRPLGYVVIQAQVDRVQGYDKDQIALVFPDLSNFVAQIPVILGTPTIGQVVNVMKEAEMDALAMPWANARAAHLLSVHRMMPTGGSDGQEEEVDSNGYDQLMYTQNVETIEPFSSCIVLEKAGRAYMGEHINVTVQALQIQGRALPCRTPTPSWEKAVKKQSWCLKVNVLHLYSAFQMGYALPKALYM